MSHVSCGSKISAPPYRGTWDLGLGTCMCHQLSIRYALWASRSRMPEFPSSRPEFRSSRSLEFRNAPGRGVPEFPSSRAKSSRIPEFRNSRPAFRNSGIPLGFRNSGIPELRNVPAFPARVPEFQDSGNSGIFELFPSSRIPFPSSRVPGHLGFGNVPEFPNSRIPGRSSGIPARQEFGNVPEFPNSRVPSGEGSASPGSQSRQPAQAAGPGSLRHSY